MAEYKTYRVVIKHDFINQKGLAQTNERVIYLDMTDSRDFSTSKLSDITMEKFIPNGEY